MRGDKPDFEFTIPGKRTSGSIDLMATPDIYDWEELPVDIFAVEELRILKLTFPNRGHPTPIDHDINGRPIVSEAARAT